VFFILTIFKLTVNCYGRRSSVTNEEIGERAEELRLQKPEMFSHPQLLSGEIFLGNLRFLRDVNRLTPKYSSLRVVERDEGASIFVSLKEYVEVEAKRRTSSWV
jgi:hypothetical protein